MNIINITFGGFQPVHNGHNEIFKTLNSLDGKSVVFVSTSDNRRGVKIETQRNAIIHLLDSPSDHVIPATNLWDVFGQSVTIWPKSKIRIVIGSDRFSNVSDAIERFIRLEHRDLSINTPIEVICVDRSLPVSGSEIRSLMENETFYFPNFSKFIPERIPLNIKYDMYRQMRDHIRNGKSKSKYLP